MNQSSDNVSTANRRASRRQSARGTTKVRAYRNHLGLGPNIALSVLDLSETGVRLFLKEPIAPGQEFEIQVDTPSGPNPKLLARVVWCIEAAEGGYCVGARFDKALPHRELMALVRP